MRVKASAPTTEEALDAALSEPREATVRAVADTQGDIVVLGAGGKMGPSMARMVKRALESVPGGASRRVVAVSRFAERDGAARLLEAAGVEVMPCDLLDRDAVRTLPDAPNVLFLAGQKFGTSQAPARTWMTNVVLPAIVAERYRESAIVAFSTGNVYPLVPVLRGGSHEDDAPAPVGEYAASCLARERIFEHAASAWGTRVVIVRLNYAIDLRYGVLTDLALALQRGDAVPLAMGYVNVIWQGDASRAAIELLPHAVSPPLVVNVAGAQLLSVRVIAEQLAARLGVAPRFTGTERTDALLSDSSRMRELVGPGDMPVDTMLDWVAEWVSAGRRVLARPTHFTTRDGTF